MEQEEYNELCKKYASHTMVRPFWIEDNYHKDYWKQKDITILICQRKTKNLIQLCLESLLSFYPDIPILIVDGNSQDDSTFYLQFKSMTYSNIKLWIRDKSNISDNSSHGEMMNEAIIDHITTKYILIFDSDVIIKRYGFIEGMLSQFEDPELYATGTLLLVTNKNDGCGLPENENDILFYPHPSCSIYRRDIYKTLKPFCDHGAPCAYNLQDAMKKGWKMGSFPVDKYVMHLSGASWTIPRTIWTNDNDIFIRPFLTFIINTSNQFVLLTKQDDQDFEIITLAKETINNVVIHSLLPIIVKNSIFDIRFHVKGEYICHIPEWVDRIDEDFVSAIKKEMLKNNFPNEHNVGGSF